MQGRFGNTALQFLFAYGFAQRHGMKFECAEWIGEKIFDLPKYERPNKDWPPNLVRFNERQLEEIKEFDRGPWNVDGGAWEYRGYAQTQFCASHYTKRQAQSWLKLQPGISSMFDQIERAYPSVIVGHRRVGDYIGYGYPIVSRPSYIAACQEFGLDPDRVWLCSEEHPTHPELMMPGFSFPDGLEFLADFARLLRAKTLLRGNSSFSWLAALLGNGLVLSPVIDGLEGGKEHRCKFVAGNHPRFANLDFVENLFVNDI